MSNNTPLSPTRGQKKSEETRLRTVVPEEKSQTETPESKPRKKRESVVVRAYEKLQNGQLKPVMIKSPAKDAVEEMVQFDSTGKAWNWCKSNLKTNGMKVEIVTIQRAFTIKAEQVTKVTMEP